MRLMRRRRTRALRALWSRLRMGLYFGVGFAGFNVATVKRAFFCFPDEASSRPLFEGKKGMLLRPENCLDGSASVSVSTRKEEQEDKRFRNHSGPRSFRESGDSHQSRFLLKAFARHFGNPAKSKVEARRAAHSLFCSADFRRLCGPRSHGVCLYRLTFKEGRVTNQFDPAWWNQKQACL